MQGLEVLNCQNWNWKVYIYCLYFILFLFVYFKTQVHSLVLKVPTLQMQCKMMS